jgi:nicotinamide-nucleotide amidase
MTLADPRAVAVVRALTERGQTLATAESLTGGLIGAAITAVPGASAVYLGGLITYATDLKARLGGVPADLLAAAGPVSAQTAAAMASGAREATGADWAVAATGVAGPDPQDGHPPGEVWLGLSGPDGIVRTVHLDLTGGRAAVRAGTVVAALSQLADAVLPAAAAVTAVHGARDPAIDQTQAGEAGVPPPIEGAGEPNRAVG